MISISFTTCGLTFNRDIDKLHSKLSQLCNFGDGIENLIEPSGITDDEDKENYEESRINYFRMFEINKIKLNLILRLLKKNFTPHFKPACRTLTRVNRHAGLMYTN